MFTNLFLKLISDAVLLALGIALSHFIIIGSAIGQSKFMLLLPFCFLLAGINIFIRMVEIHNSLTGKE